MDDNFDKELSYKKINILYRKLSTKYNIPIKEIENIVRSQYKFTIEKVKQIDKNNITDDTKTNFSYKYLGKFYFLKKKKRNE